jgi:hypothetical protein
MQTLPERPKRRFDLIQPGVVPQGEQAFDVSLGYPNAAGKLRFLQTRRQERRVEIYLSGL